MVPITVGVAAPRGSIAYDSLARTLLATRGVYAVVGVNPERGDFDANRGISVIVGMVLDRNGAGWIRELRSAGEITPVIALSMTSGTLALRILRKFSRTRSKTTTDSFTEDRKSTRLNSSHRT